MVEELQALEILTLTTETFGLVEADLYDILLDEDPTNDDPYDDSDQVFLTGVSVPSGAKRLVAEVTTSEAPDVDLFVLYNTGAGYAEVCSSATVSWAEYCDLTDPPAGDYLIVVQNWEGSADQPDAITLAVGVVPGADAGHLMIEGPASAAEMEPFDLQLFWDTPDMVAGDRWYGAFSLGTEPGSEGNIGTIPVNIIRHEDDVIKTASSDAAVWGETVTYTITVQPNVTPEDMTYWLTDTIPVGLTYVPGSLAATSGSYGEAGGVITWTGVAELRPRDYVMITSNDDPSCAMPYANSGAYVDFRAFGINPDPDIFGDTEWWGWPTSGAAPIQFYGQELASNVINFTDDGIAFFDPSTPGAEPWQNEAVPNATDPNSLLAFFWRDLEVVYEAGQRGVSLVNLTSSGVPVAHCLDFKGVQVYDDPTQRYDAQFYLSRYVDDTPGEYEIIFAYDNLVGDLDVGTIGVENPAGSDGTQYAYDDAALDALTDGTGICFDWTFVDPDPVHITYQVTVDEDVTDSPLTNMVEHTVDNEGSLSAEAAFDLTILWPDLAVSKTVTPTADVELGEVVTYTIELVNNGNVTAMGIVLTDTLPAGVLFDAFVTNAGAADEDAGVISWSGDLAKDEMLTITFTATVEEDEALYNTTITNTVEFTSANAAGGSYAASFTVKHLYRVILPLVMKNYTP